MNRAISLFLQDAIKTDFKGINYDFYSSVEKSHGRIETRKIYIVNEINRLEGKDQWQSLSSIVLVESTR